MKIMQLRGQHISKSVLIAMCIISGLITSVSGQSVYVGKAGKNGKALHKYIEPSALKEIVDQPVDTIWIIDVRSEKAYANGHIPTAKSFPSATILSRLNEIPKDKYLILYCTVGGMAKITSQKLKKAGYKRYMVWGGISRLLWETETVAQP